MKFLAVCGFGVGSSMVLKMTIEKVCRARNINCEVQNTDLTSVKGMEADAVFTSPEIAMDLKQTLKCPVFGIKKYMDQKEVEQAINQFLENQ
ncbi:PTS sugar transporter subunit IIB [Fervidibacillus halotolerans]|uniref:PTS sugar transporter subunit IIB n=1 Tax=Fervidibacillus halotolerans TaxID=2980027 RepID=A0A9E8M0D3_9BACI|nr:PTS sugar transporter subunit IIB [Fervidibacillus halotolerans]WAA13148.1 PTS sugar transporter subunit IIB [Fervidibacillus halotolerans]